MSAKCGQPEAPTRESLIVRAVLNSADCLAVATITAQAFPSEVEGQGLNERSFISIEYDELVRNPNYWQTIGLAVERDEVLGAVVLSFANEPDGSLTYWQYSRRVGCIPTLLTLAYDHVLEEPLQPSECLIDFIAVAPEARGKGVGAALMAWAEAAGAALLASRAPAAVAAAGGGCMSLWVAADNTVACRLYTRCGYSAVKSTDTGPCQCVMTRVFQRFLGHPIWIKMTKKLPSQAGLATVKPEVIELSARAITQQQQHIDRFELTPLPDEASTVSVAASPSPAKALLPPRGGSPLADRIVAHGGLMGNQATESLGSAAALVKASTELPASQLAGPAHSSVAEVGATVAALVRTISNGASAVVAR